MSSGDADRRTRWAPFVDALAGLGPLAVAVRDAGDEAVLCDLGVWSRLLRRDPRAPGATAELAAVNLALELFRPATLELHASGETAEVLAAATQAAVDRPG